MEPEMKPIPVHIHHVRKAIRVIETVLGTGGMILRHLIPVIIAIHTTIREIRTDK